MVTSSVPGLLIWRLLMRHVFQIALLAGLSGPALAQFSFTPFNLFGVGNTALRAVNLGPADRGYNAYTVAFDWQGVIGSPWSQEARFALASSNDPAAPDLVVYKFIDRPGNGAAPNSRPDGSNVRLQWSATMDNPYLSGDVWLLGFQNFPGTQANWTNISVTLNEFTPPTPPAGVVPTGVRLTAGEGVDINTFAAAFDTELGLYDSNGSLLAFNDDADPDEFGPSQILRPSGLVEGTYYIALTGHNAIFADGFAVNVNTPQGSEGGLYGLSINGVVINGEHPAESVSWLSFEVIPGPGVWSVLAMSGWLGARRRRCGLPGQAE
jgi:hypothetical protein